MDFSAHQMDFYANESLGPWTPNNEAFRTRAPTQHQRASHQQQ
jgi:hypothetical protein